MFGVVSTTYSFATVMAWWQTQVEEVSSVSSSLLVLAEEMSASAGTGDGHDAGSRPGSSLQVSTD